MNLIVEEALSNFSDVVLAEKLKVCLIPPRLEMRGWDYHSRDGQDAILPCWIIADFGQNTDVGLAYADSGHGVYGRHWGLIWISKQNFGSNNCWYGTLEDAAEDSGYLEDR